MTAALYDFFIGGAAIAPKFVWETPVVLLFAPPIPKDSPEPIPTPAVFVVVLTTEVPELKTTDNFWVLSDSQLVQFIKPFFIVKSHLIHHKKKTQRALYKKNTILLEN